MPGIIKYDFGKEESCQIKATLNVLDFIYIANTVELP